MKCKICKVEKKGKGTFCDLHLKFYFYKPHNSLEDLWRSIEEKKSQD
jgi:hypothetical protein